MNQLVTHTHTPTHTHPYPMLNPLYHVLMCCCAQVPKPCEAAQTGELQRGQCEGQATRKQVSYKTEIIGGVPIITQTQVQSTVIMGGGVNVCVCVFTRFCVCTSSLL